MSKGQALY